MSNLNIKRSLLITEEVRQQARDLQEYAFQHRQTTPQVVNYVPNAQPAKPELANHVMTIPNGFEVVYSIEQRPGRGWCQFVAVSMTTPRLDPTPESVVEILKLFGIQQKVPNKGGILRDAISIENQATANYRQAVTMLYPFDFAAWEKNHSTPASAGS